MINDIKDFLVKSWNITYCVGATDEEDALKQGYEIYKSLRVNTTFDVFCKEFKVIDITRKPMVGM